MEKDDEFYRLSPIFVGGGGWADRNSKRSLPVTHMPHCSLWLCPSYEWTYGQTHGHMSLGANPPLLSVLETHLLT